MKISKELHDKLVKLHTAILDAEGRELLNPNPLFVEVGEQRETLQEQVRRMLHQELSRSAYDQGMETFEEADDFDVEEDDFPISEHEIPEMVEEILPDQPEPVVEKTPVPVETAPVETPPAE